MASTAVSALSLESYVQLFKALTKGTDKVQSVTPIEECYYKIADLRQLLVVHGMSAGKFNRCELLQALKGKALINPISISQQTTTGHQPSSDPSPPPPGQPTAQPCSAAACSSDVSSILPFSAADIASLGWAEAGEMIAQPLEQLQLNFVTGPGDMQLPTAGSTPVLTGLTPPAAPAALQPPPAAAGQQALAQVGHSAPMACVGGAALPPPACSHPAAGASSSMPVQGLPVRSVPPQLPLHLAAAAAAAGSSGGVAAGAGNGSNICSSAAPAAVFDPGNGSGDATTATAQQQAALLAKEQQAGSTAAGQAPAALVAGAENMLRPPNANDSASRAALSSACPKLTACHSTENEAAQQQQQQQQQKGIDSNAAADQEVIRLLKHAGLHQPGLRPVHEHTSWLLQKLQHFALGGAVASNEQLPAGAAAGQAGSSSGSNLAAAVPGAGGGGVLLGRHVSFVLMEDMQVAGTRNTVQTLPAGVYEGHAVKYLGSSCQPELCEATCPGNHQHYRARIMPPQLLPGKDLQSTQLPGSSEADAVAAAAAASQAHAAISGRPVLLILDLHPRLRCRSYRELLSLTAEQLQDAWVLLEERGNTPSSPDAAQQPGKTVVAGGGGGSAAAAVSRRGRPPGHRPSHCGLPPSKRTKSVTAALQR